jgi:hypothetical protein
MRPATRKVRPGGTTKEYQRCLQVIGLVVGATDHAGVPKVFLSSMDRVIVQKDIGLRDSGIYETEGRTVLGLPIETFEDAGEVFLSTQTRPVSFWARLSR